MFESKAADTAYEVLHPSLFASSGDQDLPQTSEISNRDVSSASAILSKKRSREMEGSGQNHSAMAPESHSEAKVPKDEQKGQLAVIMPGSEGGGSSRSPMATGSLAATVEASEAVEDDGSAGVAAIQTSFRSPQPLDDNLKRQFLINKDYKAATIGKGGIAGANTLMDEVPQSPVPAVLDELVVEDDGDLGARAFEEGVDFASPPKTADLDDEVKQSFNLKV